MRLLRRYKFGILFFAVMVFCSAMVTWQINVNRARHVDVREAFILLHTRGYTNQADRMYERLLKDMSHLSNAQLMEDFQRTAALVDPSLSHPENKIWRYHWTVSNELERRSESTLKRALELSGQE